MHKGILLLTKATDKDEAKSNVESFLEGYGDGKVWDWYVIGGRWSGVLNKSAVEFYKLADKLFVAKNKGKKKDYVSMQDVEDSATELQTIWEKLGEKSRNPFNRDNYKSGLDSDTLPTTDDVMLATEAEVVIRKWAKENDMKKQAQEFWDKMVEEKKRGKDETMSAYYAKRYAECQYDDFCFESSVYDIEKGTNTPPEDLTGYYCVVVDMHN